MATSCLLPVIHPARDTYAKSPRAANSEKDSNHGLSPKLGILPVRHGACDLSVFCGHSGRPANFRSVATLVEKGAKLRMGRHRSSPALKGKVLPSISAVSPALEQVIAEEVTLEQATAEEPTVEESITRRKSLFNAVQSVNMHSPKNSPKKGRTSSKQSSRSTSSAISHPESFLWRFGELLPSKQDQVEDPSVTSDSPCKRASLDSETGETTTEETASALEPNKAISTFGDIPKHKEMELPVILSPTGSASLDTPTQQSPKHMSPLSSQSSPKHLSPPPQPRRASLPCIEAAEIRRRDSFSYVPPVDSLRRRESLKDTDGKVVLQLPLEARRHQEGSDEWSSCDGSKRNKNGSSNLSSILEPLHRFRYHLRSKFGSVRRAFKAFDANGCGRVSFADFERGLEKHEVRWMETSGIRDMHMLFKELDVDGIGAITCSRLLGSMQEASDEHDDWQYLTTMEKWTRWCSHTEKPQAKTENHHTWQDPLHKATEDISAMRCQKEGERDRSRARMQRMIQQGMHRTKAGLHLAATHLPKDIGAEHFSVQRYRQHALEKVEQQSKRIKQQIEHTSLARHELKHCSQALRSVEEKRNRENAQEWLQEHRTDLKIPHARKSTLTFDLVNDFSEDQLEEEERNLRMLARSLGIPLPDAEAIQAQYRAHVQLGEGVTLATFPKIVRSLMGGIFSDTKLHELWRTLDTDNRGHIMFEEYLEWHYLNLDCPHLSRQMHLNKSPDKSPSTSPSSSRIRRSSVSFASLPS